MHQVARVPGIDTAADQRDGCQKQEIFSAHQGKPSNCGVGG
jgi:hypothetical protein